MSNTALQATIAQQDNEIRRVLAYAQRALDLSVKRGLIMVPRALSSRALRRELMAQEAAGRASDADASALFADRVPLREPLDIVDALLGELPEDMGDGSAWREGGDGVLKVASVQDIASVLDHIGVLGLDVDDREGDDRHLRWVKMLFEAALLVREYDERNRKVNYTGLFVERIVDAAVVSRTYRRKAIVLHPDKIKQVGLQLESQGVSTSSRSAINRVRAARVAFEVLGISRDVLLGQGESGDGLGSEVKLDETKGGETSEGDLEAAVDGRQGSKDTVEEVLRKVPRARIAKVLVEAAEEVLLEKYNARNNKGKQVPSSKIDIPLKFEAVRQKAVLISAKALLGLADIQQRRFTLVRNLLFQKQRKEERRAQQQIQASKPAQYLTFNDDGAAGNGKTQSKEKVMDERVKSWRGYLNNTGSSGANHNAESTGVPDAKTKSEKRGVSETKESPSSTSTSTSFSSQNPTDNPAKKKKKKKKKTKDDPLGIYS